MPPWFPVTPDQAAIAARESIPKAASHEVLADHGDLSPADNCKTPNILDCEIADCKKRIAMLENLVRQLMEAPSPNRGNLHGSDTAETPKEDPNSSVKGQPLPKVMSDASEPPLTRNSSNRYIKSVQKQMSTLQQSYSKWIKTAEKKIADVDAKIDEVSKQQLEKVASMISEAKQEIVSETDVDAAKSRAIDPPDCHLPPNSVEKEPGQDITSCNGLHKEIQSIKSQTGRVLAMHRELRDKVRGTSENFDKANQDLRARLSDAEHAVKTNGLAIAEITATLSNQKSLDEMLKSSKDRVLESLASAANAIETQLKGDLESNKLENESFQQKYHTHLDNLKIMNDQAIKDSSKEMKVWVQKSLDSIKSKLGNPRHNFSLANHHQSKPEHPTNVKPATDRISDQQSLRVPRPADSCQHKISWLKGLTDGDAVFVKSNGRWINAQLYAKNHSQLFFTFCDDKKNGSSFKSYWIKSEQDWVSLIDKIHPLTERSEY